MKVEICMVITEVIFKDNGDWAETFKDHPAKFHKAVQDQLGILKKSYCKQAVKFTQTGNGVMLDAEEAVENQFLWYSDLHSLWRGIPLYTPKAIVNSTPGASCGMQLLALVQPKSVLPPPSGPPSAPSSIPEPPQVLCLPIEPPSSTVGQDKGKQRADEPPRPWDDVNIDINVDVDVDMDMGGEEDLYKDGCGHRSLSRAETFSISMTTITPSPHAVHIPK
ncbi:hypothetical protein PAXRUDRAFT_21659 [Paxillus rubicundulus Ve08.2h10]|uniref:Unplaced genomic scaffold scaffold_5691, whole genome shotgun sequence n=1 Tax=Paxillus rubicundulus Ve08.2h10 TaxID=930991 RepID=A0A0D0D6Z9_9AGAM|nr:hypothetical protein PAXRUDRAFT_21659 [Paxillus rubicundulus Ve08.2h10]